MSSRTQNSLILPLLEVLDASGGSLPAKAACQGVAERLDLTKGEQERRIEIGDRDYSAFDRDVRWARQKAVLRGYIGADTRGIWNITPAGKKGLRDQVPGKIVTVFETENGVAIWASAEDAVGFVERESVDLVFTSPPYPLLRPKDYGNLATREWLDWMTRLADGWGKMLSPRGSLMLNLGQTCERGQPTQSPYIERLTLRLIDDLGFHLCDRLFWHNPAKLPAPAEWVTVRRVRVKQSVEPVLWFSRSPNPKADNRRVLVPYSESMRRYTGSAKAQSRPSGHKFAEGAFATTAGGAIPPSLLQAANTSSNSAYQKACKAAGLPLHPATFPRALPEFAIKLTTEPGDLVYDPFFGSGTTAAAAETLGRRWIGTERSLAYLAGAAKRFERAKIHAELP